MRRCDVEDCERPHYAFGLCNLHYTRQRTGRHLTAPVGRVGYRSGRIEDVNWDVLPHDAARAAVARYLTGENIVNVAGDFGCSTHAIHRWVGLSQPTENRRSDTIELPADQLARMLHEGCTVAKLASHFHVSDGHVRNEVARLGLGHLRAEGAAERRRVDRLAKEERRRKKAAERDERNAQLRREYEAGDTLAVLADRHKVSETLVWRRLQQAGADTSRRRGRGRRVGYERIAMAMGLQLIDGEPNADLEQRLINTAFELRCEASLRQNVEVGR